MRVVFLLMVRPSGVESFDKGKAGLGGACSGKGCVLGVGHSLRNAVLVLDCGAWRFGIGNALGRSLCRANFEKGGIFQLLCRESREFWMDLPVAVC